LRAPDVRAHGEANDDDRVFEQLLRTGERIFEYLPEGDDRKRSSWTVISDQVARARKVRSVGFNPGRRLR
jgi:hypothetical protein